MGARRPSTSAAPQRTQDERVGRLLRGSGRAVLPAIGGAVEHRSTGSGCTERHCAKSVFAVRVASPTVPHADEEADRMALTLAEGAKLSNDVLLEGVIETVINDSPVLQRMPFVEIVGNGLTYNRENAAATAAFYSVGDTWAENTPTFTQITTALTILGGDADVDNYLARTRNNVQDLEAAVVALKAKAVQQKFDETFINGDVGVDTKAFDG